MASLGQRHYIDWDALHYALQGVQISDTVRRFAPLGVDVEFEENALLEAELAEIDGIKPVPGSDIMHPKQASMRSGVVTGSGIWNESALM